MSTAARAALACTTPATRHGAPTRAPVHVRTLSMCGKRNSTPECMPVPSPIDERMPRPTHHTTYLMASCVTPGASNQPAVATGREKSSCSPAPCRRAPPAHLDVPHRSLGHPEPLGRGVRQQRGQEQVDGERVHDEPARALDQRVAHELAKVHERAPWLPEERQSAAPGRRRQLVLPRLRARQVVHAGTHGLRSQERLLVLLTPAGATSNSPATGPGPAPCTTGHHATRGAHLVRLRLSSHRRLIPRVVLLSLLLLLLPLLLLLARLRHEAAADGVVRRPGCLREEARHGQWASQRRGPIERQGLMCRREELRPAGGARVDSRPAERAEVEGGGKRERQ